MIYIYIYIYIYINPIFCNIVISKYKYITTYFSKFGYSKVSYHTEWTTALPNHSEEATSSTNLLLTMSSVVSTEVKDDPLRIIVSTTKILNKQLSNKSDEMKGCQGTILPPQYDSSLSTSYKQFKMRYHYIITASIVIIFL